MRLPLLAISGEQDHEYPVGNASAIVETVKNGHLAVVPRAGHSVSLEQPAVVNALLSQHLDATVRSHTARRSGGVRGRPQRGPPRADSFKRSGARSYLFLLAALVGAG